jgi:hypothetical protein
MVYHHTKLDMPSFNGALVTTTKQKNKHIFHTATNLAWLLTVLNAYQVSWNFAYGVKSYYWHTQKHT